MIWGWPVQAWLGLIFFGIVFVIGLQAILTLPSKNGVVRPPRRKWK